MADHHEQAIATYLALDGWVFLAAQFNVAFDRELNEGGACPDFVALDLHRRHVVVIEVTAAADMNPLLGRVKDRQTRWYTIRRHLKQLGILNDEWQVTRFLGFVRFQNYETAKRFAASMDDVAFYPIEAASFPWDYWDDRIRSGLPDRSTVLPAVFLAARAPSKPA